VTARDKAPWITYRPELKVLDCTVRDGGLINDHQFDDAFVRAVYDTCVEAGIDYMEIGYKNSPKLHPKSRFGPWRHCDEEDLKRVVGDHDPARVGLKLAAMADAGKSDWREQIIPKQESVLDMIRVACYVHQIPEAVAMVRHAHEMGYETSCNIMAISTVTEIEVDQALEVLADTPAGTIVVVDSFGSLYREQIDNLVRKYLDVCRRPKKEVGIHAHNNMQLAFANTIEAIILGCNRVDATIAGLGRGAGNCPMELLLGFLRNPKFKLRPIIRLIQEQFGDLRRDLVWGPLIPYNITGQMNSHPRSAIEFLGGEEPDNVLAFYDKLVADI
jgi:4-hydroxy 2-oxovalerate aldolase